MLTTPKKLNRRMPIGTYGGVRGMKNLYSIPVIIAASFARIFYRNGINVGLPLLEIGDDVEKIHAGDRLSVDLATGKITDITTGDTFQAPPLPGFIQDIAKAGGLINYVKEYR